MISAFRAGWRGAACLLLASLSFASFGQAGAFERGEPLPRRGFLGAQLAPEQGGGVKIVRVLPGGAAEAAKLKEGDVVLSMNGAALASPAEAAALIRTLVGGQAVEYKVKRGSESLTLKAPMPPRPKAQEEGLEVIYDQVVSQGKRVRVIATHPKGEGPFPTFFVIGGIGAYSMDAPLASAPYGPILKALSQKMAIIRVEKPGQGDSEGPAYTDLMFNDELDAYVQAMRLTKSLPFVDKERIVIFGHSMGGAFGPLVAQTEKVAGVIAVGTMTKTWVEYVLENSRRQAALAGATPEQVDEQLRPMAGVAWLLFGQGLTPKEASEKHPDLAPLIQGISPDGKTYSGVNTRFFHQLAQHNLVAAWKKADTKTLMMWGENDFISTEWDHSFLAESLNAVKPGQAEFKKIPNSDHGFFKTESFQDSMAKWGRPGSEFNTNVVGLIRDWLAASLQIQA